MNKLNHLDRKKTIYEALMLVTQRKGRTVYGSEIAKSDAKDTETVRYKKVLIHLLVMFNIPNQIIFVEFNVFKDAQRTRKAKFRELFNRSPDLVELGLINNVKDEIPAISQF